MFTLLSGNTPYDWLVPIIVSNTKISELLKAYYGVDVVCVLTVGEGVFSLPVYRLLFTVLCEM